MQVLGFVVLVSGTSLYNELIRSCLPTMYESTIDSDLEVGSSQGLRTGLFAFLISDLPYPSISARTGSDLGAECTIWALRRLPCGFTFQLDFQCSDTAFNYCCPARSLSSRYDASVEGRPPTSWVPRRIPCWQQPLRTAAWQRGPPQDPPAMACGPAGGAPFEEWPGRARSAAASTPWPGACACTRPRCPRTGRACPVQASSANLG